MWGLDILGIVWTFIIVGLDFTIHTFSPVTLVYMYLDFSYCEARRCAWRWPKGVVCGLYIFGILWTLHLVLIGVYYTYILSGDNNIDEIELYIL